MTDGSTIPAHLVLGSLGSGKTTTILSLLEIKSPDETWAVFINEFGRVPVDPDLIRGSVRTRDRLVIHGSPGGCICCSGALDLASGIRELVTRHKAGRIIIEPTGLSDPRSLKNQIQQFGDSWGVHMASTIGVIDIRVAGHQRFREMPYIRSMIACSDFLLGSRKDIVSPETFSRFNERINRWMNDSCALFTDRTELAESDWHAPVQRSDVSFFESTGKTVHSTTYSSTGWTFDRTVQFDLDVLLAGLREYMESQQQIARLKGILQTNKGWFSVQSNHDQLSVRETADPESGGRLMVIIEGENINAFQSPAFLSRLQATQVHRTVASRHPPM